MKHFFLYSGLTAVELIVAMTLSAVVISAAYKAQVSFSKAASRENDKAILQRDLMSVCDALEKDIRMAGLGLPGNGIELILSDTASDQLSMFVNKDHVVKVLSANVSSADTKILINNIGITKWGEWVCLNGSSKIYREISRVGKGSGTNPDTVYLYGQANAGSIAAGSNVYSANRIVYYMKNGAEKKLVRRFNRKDTPVSTIIDSLSINPKNNNGLAVSYGTDARVITAIVGGYVGKESKRYFLAESTEVNIRNSN